MNTKVNLNDKVKFQITEYGKKILEKYFVKLEEYYKVPKDSVNHLRGKFSKELIEMSLWEFMSIFGEYCYCGAENSCENNEIEICQN